MVVSQFLPKQQCQPPVERDAIHGIKPNSVPRDERHYTFGSTRIVSRFDQLVCHLLPARRTLSRVAI
jgi:hypothetical protein